MKSETIHELTSKIKEVAFQLRRDPQVDFGYSTMIVQYAQDIEQAVLLPDEQQELIEDLQAQVQQLQKEKQTLLDYIKRLDAK